MSNPSKGHGMDRVKRFQRHYFPEIFAENKSSQETAEENLRGFQRTELANFQMRSSSDSPPLSAIARPSAAGDDFPRPEEADSAQRYAQGYEEGQRAGIAEERGRLESIIKMLGLAMGEVEQLKADLTRAAERQTVHLALSVARKILNSEVQTRPEAVAHVIAGALAHCQEAEQLTVKVNPGDLHILSSLEFRAPEFNGIMENCNFEGDEQVQPGGCLIQSDLGEIDARIANQLQLIEEHFTTLLDETESS
ncbi:MAG: FliH/SctL family protein [Desulfobacterales bacterium]